MDTNTESTVSRPIEIAVVHSWETIKSERSLHSSGPRKIHFTTPKGISTSKNELSVNQTGVVPSNATLKTVTSYLSNISSSFFYSVYSDRTEDEESESKASTSRTIDKKSSTDTTSSYGKRLAEFRKRLTKYKPMNPNRVTSVTSTTEINNQKISGSKDHRMFVAAMVIGLSNLMVFPLNFQKYGGVSYLIAFVLICIFLGYPMIILEVGVGQFTSKGPGGCWEMAKLFVGVGYSMLYFTLVDKLGLVFKASLGLVLQYEITYEYPWEPGRFADFAELAHFLNIPEFDPHLTRANSTNSSVEHDDHHGETDWIEWNAISFYTANIFLITIFLLPSFFTRAKIARVLFIFSIMTVVVIFIKSLTLPGALNGVNFAFESNDFSELLNPKMWLTACQHVFWSLNLEPGSHMTMASYNHFNNQIPYDVVILIAADIFASLVMTVMSFSLIGHLTHVTSYSFDDFKGITDNEFLFMRLPQSLSKLENGKVWVFFFFILINVTVHVNLTTVYEILITGVIDIFNLSNTRRTPVALSVGLLLYLISSWMVTSYNTDILIILELYFNGIYSSVIAIWMVVPFVWVFGVDRLLSMIECSVGWCTTPLLSHPRWKLWWKICWKYFAPTVYVTLTISSLTHSFLCDKFNVESWLNHTGLSLWAVAFLLISAPMLYLLITTDKGGFTSRLEFLTTPSEKWGPVLAQHKYIMQIGEEDMLREKNKGHHKFSERGWEVKNYRELSLYGELFM